MSGYGASQFGRKQTINERSGETDQPEAFLMERQSKYRPPSLSHLSVEVHRRRDRPHQPKAPFRPYSSDA